MGQWVWSTGGAGRAPTASTQPQEDVMAAKKSSGGSGKQGRSAITGKFVKQSTVRRHPNTTVNESRNKKK